MFASIADARRRYGTAGVHHVNLHGTSTELNDRTETRALCSCIAFGARNSALVLRQPTWS